MRGKTTLTSLAAAALLAVAACAPGGEAPGEAPDAVPPQVPGPPGEGPDQLPPAHSPPPQHPEVQPGGGDEQPPADEQQPADQLQPAQPPADEPTY